MPNPTADTVLPAYARQLLFRPEGFRRLADAHAWRGAMGLHIAVEATTEEMVRAAVKSRAGIDTPAIYATVECALDWNHLTPPADAYDGRVTVTVTTKSNTTVVFAIQVEVY